MAEMNAVEKAFAVLQAVADPDGPHRLGDLATRVELPKSTVHRILQLLGRDGYVMPVLPGAYSIGPRALALAGQVLAGGDLRALVDPILHQLHQETGHTVHFAVRDGSAAIYVSKVEGEQPYRMASRVGASIPLHCTAIGKAVLAALSDDEVRRILETSELPIRTPHTLRTIPAVLKDLREIRKRGFSIDDEENESNVRCVGAAVRNSLSDIVGGISVSALAFELSYEGAISLGPRLRAAATAVSAALGDPGTNRDPVTFPEPEPV